MCNTYSYKEQDGEIDTTSGTDSSVITKGQGHGMMQSRVFMPGTNWEGALQMEESTHPCVVRFPRSLLEGCKEFVGKKKTASSRSILQLCLRVIRRLCQLSGTPCNVTEVFPLS